MSAVEQARAAVRAWLRCVGERYALQVERETARHVSAAADRWREALERIARTVVMPGRDFNLSGVPELVEGTIAACHREIKRTEARLLESAGHALAATKAQREAELFAREAMKRLLAVLSSVPADEFSAEVAEWWKAQPRKYGGGGEP